MESTTRDELGSPERLAYLTQPRKKRRLDHDRAAPDGGDSTGDQVPEPHKNGESSYILSRSYGATTRLNSQHLLWKLELGWCLHPALQALISTAVPIVTALPQVSAPTVTSSTQQLNPLAAHPDTFRIADLATGTAIWAIDISQDFPLAQIDCFDIDLQQCPPPPWLPHNVKAHQWDIYTDLTPELEGLYDVVHIRLLLLVIRDNDPRPILKSALRMLKKGGYLQWDELDPWGAFTVVASNQLKDETVNDFQKRQELTAMSTLEWVKDLHCMMGEIGFKDVRREG
ncbi:MAG: hypothetical protein Q9226_003310, partial [Calogaya cf. arnoldii]